MGSNGSGGGVGLRVSAEQVCIVLFNDLSALDRHELEAVLEAWLGPCDVQIARVSSGGLAAGTVIFEQHRVVILATPAPVGKEVLARTVGIAPMPAEARAEMLSHRAAMRLLYVGESASPLEQLTALYTLAGALLNMGGLGIVNERAALAVPARLAERYLAQLGSDPPPIQLWVGAVVFNLDEGEDEAARYLIRTYGMEQMRLPDLCVSLRDRSWADDAFHALINICLYMAESAADQPIGEGDRVDFGGRTYLLVEPGSEVQATAGSGRLLMALEV